MASSHRAPADLEHLIGIIAGRWQDLTGHHQGIDIAPWGYLVGVPSSPASTHEPPAWPVHPAWPVNPVWDPHHPRPGFTVLHCHPAVALRGFVTPSDWQAVGVAVHGMARRIGATGSGRAAVVWLCHRNGSTASWLSLPGDDPVVTISAPSGHVATLHGGDRGVVAGLLRRSLHRHSDPVPPAPPAPPAPPGPPSR